MTIKVRCTLVVDVEIPDDVVDPEFMIEENSCPGTGFAGNAIDRAIEDGETRGVCWACNLQGKNEILAINGVPFKERKQ